MKPSGPRREVTKTHYDDVASADGPFALDTEEPSAGIEHEVVAKGPKRFRDADAELDRLSCNRGLGNRAFLVRGQHSTEARRRIGWAVS